MSSIDLIPAEYHERRSLRRHLRLAIGVAAVVSALMIAATAGLKQATAAIVADHADAQLKLSMTAQQREQLERMDTQIAALTEEWQLLRGLRSGAAAEELFEIVDRALTGDEVWFDDWQFRRAGVLVPQAPKTINTGYFIVVPAGQTGTEPADWQVQTHMSINGQSRDHAALSRFVRGLYAQPQIHDVKLNGTRIRHYDNGKTVEFDLAVVLRSEPAQSP